MINEAVVINKGSILPKKEEPFIEVEIKCPECNKWIRAHVYKSILEVKK